MTSDIVGAALVLADGSVFEGEHIGARPSGGVASGEVVFNTALSGYQEVISDPSYAGQIITFTYPHIGNYGVAGADNESAGVHARGVIVRDLARRHSNWRAEQDLEQFLVASQLAGIAGIDTRRLTRLLRSLGPSLVLLGRSRAREPSTSTPSGLRPVPSRELMASTW